MTIHVPLFYVTVQVLYQIDQCSQVKLFFEVALQEAIFGACRVNEQVAGKRRVNHTVDL